MHAWCSALNTILISTALQVKLHYRNPSSNRKSNVFLTKDRPCVHLDAVHVACRTAHPHRFLVSSPLHAHVAVLGDHHLSAPTFHNLWVRRPIRKGSTPQRNQPLLPATGFFARSHRVAALLGSIQGRAWCWLERLEGVFSKFCLRISTPLYSFRFPRQQAFWDYLEGIIR